MGNKGCENVHIFLGIWKAKFSPSVGRMIREDHGIAPPADLQRLHKQAVVAKARAVNCRGGCGRPVSAHTQPGSEHWEVLSPFLCLQTFKEMSIESLPEHPANRTEASVTTDTAYSLYRNG